ncbi:MAG: malonate decarboxylase holo-[acyl-carrier-protein] synthase [Verrucomicrobiota bacterium]
MIPLRRHSLVWLSRAPQPDLPADVAAVDRWHADGHPFVVCRSRGGSDLLSLGFCLPVSGLRPRRIAAQARPDQIVRAARPPSLGDIAALQPAAFARLSDSAACAGLDIRVFGSWMWQALTGESHVNASSDLDVLIEVADAAGADLAAEFLQREASACPFNLDGELSFPGLGEVHWREYLNGEPSILVKSVNTVRMVRREELWK